MRYFFRILVFLAPIFLLSCDNNSHQGASTSKINSIINTYDNNSDSKYIEIYNTIYIRLALEQSLYEKALSLFIQDISHMNDLDLYGDMAKIGLQQHKYKDVEQIVERWLLLNEKNLLAHRIGISVYLESSNYMKSKNILNNYITLIGKNDRTNYLKLMNMLVDNKNKSNVITFFDDYLLNNKNRQLIEAVIELLRSYRQDEKVIKYIDKIGAYNDRKLIRYKASSLSAINKNTEAIQLLQEYIESKSIPDRQVKYELLNLYFRTNKLESAENLIIDILNIDPQNYNIILEIARLAYDLKQYDISEKHLSYLLTLNYKENEVNYLLGLIDYENKNFVESIRHYERVDGGDFKFDARLQKSRSIAKEMGLTIAIEYLEDLKKNYVSDLMKVRIIMTQILLYSEHNKHKDIIHLVTINLPKYSHFESLIYSRAMAYETLKNVDAMEKDLKSILSRDSRNAIALNALGYSLIIHTNRYDEAYNYISKALQYEPGNAAILDSMGWVLYKKGDYNNALYYLESAYNKNQDPEIIEHYCEVLVKNGLYEKSIEIMKQAIKNYPENLKLLEKLTSIHKNVSF